MTKAIRLHGPGSADAFVWEDIEVGQPGAGEIRLRQEASGLNFIDVYHRTGLYPVPSYPAVIGTEGAGVVTAVGEGVTDIKAGDRVGYAGSMGSYAEERLLPADRAIPLPDAISSETAASVLLQGMTAHYLIFDTYKVEAGTTILLHAAAGGVGQILLQWAKALGATVIATVGSAAKAAIVKKLGADHVIDYTQENFKDRVRAILGGPGVDVVYDSVGKATFLDGFDCLRPRGLMVTFGQSSGSVAAFDPTLLSQKGSLFLTRPSLPNHVAKRDEMLRRAGALFAALEKKTIVLAPPKIYPLRDVALAHKDLEARRTTGSTVFKI